ncbi:MAG: hypothetical protein COZ43_11880 [Sphingomonadales bacterium CG_4_10_14_3_um_filter_58_15]|nr:MAG: hypothetical protein COZ43_11880 [Sphingomonadales bacterium CG_4_10_14_3_um_filter_58_15]
MKPKHSTAKKPAERVVKDIRRATRWHFSAEDKHVRSGNLNRCLNGIYLQIGVRRTNDMMFNYKTPSKLS